MTLYEALAELGVDAEAGPSDARRAYLRLLKTRKPETDPEGFMRLREAYELAKEHLEWRARLARAEASLSIEAIEAAKFEEPRIEEPTIEPPAIEPPEPPVLESKSAEIPEKKPEVPPAPPDRLDEILGSITLHEPEPERVADAAAPDAEASHDDEDEEDDDDEEVDDDEEPATVAEIEALIAQGVLPLAAEEMSKLLDHAALNLDRPMPPVQTCLSLLATLHAEGHIEPAGALFSSFSAWLKATGQETRILRGQDAARWNLTRELAALPPKFPRKLRGPIARAVIGGDLSAAQRPLAKFADELPGAARTAAAQLRSRAPLIAAALAEVLDPPPPPMPEPRLQGSTGSGSRAGWAIPIAIIGLIRIIMLFARSSSSPPSYDYNSFRPPPYTPPFDAWDAGSMRTKPLAMSSADILRSDALVRLAQLEAATALDFPAISKKASVVLGAIEQRDCKGSKAAMKALEAQVRAVARKDGGRALQPEFNDLERSIRDYCIELAYTTGDAGAAAPDAGKSGKGKAGAAASATSAPSAAKPAMDAGRCGGTGDP